MFDKIGSTNERSGSMITWILIWAVLAIPMFFYETSLLPYHAALKFGFDPIAAIYGLIVLCPFFYYLVK